MAGHNWRVDLKQLEYFVQVAQTGSFSRAADELGIGQPALSRQVRALEVDLRQTLLTRTGRGVALTEPGRQLLERGREMLQLAQATRQELGALRGEPVGQIAVGLPPSLARRLTVPLIEQFQAEMPRARIGVVEAFSAHICEWLNASKVDLGLVYNPEAQSGLEIAPVLVESLCLVGPPGSDPRETVELSELARLPLVMPQSVHSFRRLLESRAAMAGVKLQVAHEVSSVPTILEMVRRGHGYAALMESAMQANPESEGLTRATIVEPCIDSTLCIAWGAQRRRDALHLRTSALLSQLVRGEGLAPD
jgi:LysR family transcriptional regulator, nitrogen assimilation regulatory protein